MTVSVPTATSFRYEGNGVTDTFAYDARVFATSDVVVEIYVRSTDAFVETLTQTTDYTVTILSDGSASVEVTNATKIPSATQDILLIRSVPREQTLALPTGTVFPAKQVENRLDRITVQIQDIGEELSRSAQLPPQILNNITLPIPSADKIIGWDSLGEELVNFTPNTSTYLNVSAFMVTLLDDLTAAAALTTLGVSSFAQTLIDDADAGTARSTLSAASSGANSDITGLTGLNVTKSLFIPAYDMSPNTSSPCSALTEFATGDFQARILAFDATSAESANIMVKLPNGWNNGTITAKFHWSHAATTVNFGVRWVLGAVSVGNDDTLVNSETAQGAVNDTGGTTNDLYITDATSAITIAGTPTDGDLIFLKVTRDATNGADTMAIDARLHSIELFYSVTTLDDS